MTSIELDIWLSLDYDDESKVLGSLGKMSRAPTLIGDSKGLVFISFFVINK